MPVQHVGPGRARAQFEAAVLHPARRRKRYHPAVYHGGQHRVLHVWQHQAVPGEGSERHQRQLHFPVHQEMRRFPHLRVGIGATPVAEPHQFLVYRNTLIEEHIVGIPGDVFINQRLESLSMQDKRALAKEYVKFNERCFLRLLGDMRSYNYVVVITQDFDRIQYRLRAIDFDQQSYEGDARVYKPVPSRERRVDEDDARRAPRGIGRPIRQGRAFIAGQRAASESQRLHDLLACMKEDHISVEGKIDELKGELFSLTGDINFKKAPNMGTVLQAALDFVRRNYKTENPFMR